MNLQYEYYTSFTFCNYKTFSNHKFGKVLGIIILWCCVVKEGIFTRKCAIWTIVNTSIVK